MKKDCSCGSAACKRKGTSYNHDVELDIFCHEQRGKLMIDILCAFQILEITIHTILKINRGLKQRKNHRGSRVLF
jgi:hypothetical protein